MSYWIYLRNDDGKNVAVDHFEEGGTRVLGGTVEAELNVTYNYYEVFALVDWSLTELNGRSASETMQRLQELTEILPNRPYRADYWAPTPGNAGAVVHLLLSWAKQHPDAVWVVR